MGTKGQGLGAAPVSLNNCSERLVVNPIDWSPDNDSLLQSPMTVECGWTYRVGLTCHNVETPIET